MLFMSSTPASERVQNSVHMRWPCRPIECLCNAARIWDGDSADFRKESKAALDRSAAAAGLVAQDREDR